MNTRTASRLKSPKHQIEPEVSVLELLNLLQGISWHFTVRLEGLAGPSLVHYSLAQIFTKEAHPSLPGTQHLPKYSNSACTLSSGRKVWRVVSSAQGLARHKQPEEEEVGDGSCAPPA